MINNIRISAFSLPILLLPLLAMMPQASALEQILMQVTGIQGEATLKDYKDWIEITAYEEKITGPTDSVRGTPTIGDIKVTKELDKSSPLLALACCQGTVIADVRIVFVTDSHPEGPYVYYEIKFTNVMIESVSMTGSDMPGGVTINQVIGINASSATVEWIYNTLEGDEFRTNWDFGNRTP